MKYSSIKKFAVMGLVSFIAACGQSNPQPILQQPIGNIPGGLLPGGCVPVTTPVSFQATGARINSQRVSFGQVPYSGAYGQVIVGQGAAPVVNGGLTVAGQNFTNSSIQMSISNSNMIPGQVPGQIPVNNNPYGGYNPYQQYPTAQAGTAMVTGIITVSQQLLQTYGYNTYNNMNMYGNQYGNQYNPYNPYQPNTGILPNQPNMMQNQVCVSQIAADVAYTVSAPQGRQVYGGTVYVYLNNSNSGVPIEL